MITNDLLFGTTSRHRLSYTPSSISRLCGNQRTAVFPDAGVCLTADDQPPLLQDRLRLTGILGSLSRSTRLAARDSEHAVP